MNKIVALLFLISMASCSSQEQAVQEGNMKTSYETWVAGVRGGGSGIHFYVDFKTALSDQIELKKVVFRGYEVPFEKMDNLHFMARIKTEGNQQKQEGDDSQIYTSPKNALTLGENEAILIFSKKAKEFNVKIKQVTEKPMLEYTSAKPKF